MILIQVQINFELEKYKIIQIIINKMPHFIIIF